jgi:hypothetical protein
LAIDAPISDTGRAIQHDPDQTWPTSVTITLWWDVGGEMRQKSVGITAAQFFGRGAYGAPLPGDAVIGMIENMRKAGPPPAPRKTGRQPNAAKSKARSKR